MDSGGPEGTDDGSWLVDWLLDGVQVSPGSHDFSLVIDPLNTVNETSESDNTITRTVTMLGSQEPDTPVELLPNLVPAPHSKKPSPIFASSHSEDANGLARVAHTHLVSQARPRRSPGSSEAIRR